MELIFGRVVAKTLLPTGFIIGAHYGLLAAAHVYLVPSESRAAMVAIAAFSAVVLLGLSFWLRGRPDVRQKYPHQFQFVVCVFVVFNSVGHVAVVQDLSHSTNVALVLAGGGFLILAPWVFWLTMAGAGGGWLAVTWQSAFEPEWNHYLFLLASASVVGVLAWSTRAWSLLQLDTSRALLEASEERRKLEARTQHAQRLESLGQFASGITHDFNSLLTVISGNAELLAQNEAEGGDTAERQRLTRSILEHCRLAEELIDQILAYAGKAPTQLRPVDVSRIVGGVDRLLRASVDRRIDLRLELCPKTPPAMIDEQQLRQIVLNFVTNAAQAIGERPGRVRIRTDGTSGSEAAQTSGRVVVGTPDPDREYVRLIVSDDGDGMDQATINRIFDPFFTTKRGGKGLGLAFVSGIVRRAGGSIGVDSTRGVGTTMTVLLPAAEFADAANEAGAASAS